MVYLKKKDYKKEKMVLITGTVMIFIAAIAGTQFTVLGRVYIEKLKFMENKGYELNGSVPWSEYDTWVQDINTETFRGKMADDVREVMDWMEWYGLLKEAEKAPIYDESLFGPVHYCDESYCLWFITVDSRIADGKGHIQTYVIFPE
jgi:hypothetical protein